MGIPSWLEAPEHLPSSRGSRRVVGTGLSEPGLPLRAKAVLWVLSCEARPAKARFRRLGEESVGEPCPSPGRRLTVTALPDGAEGSVSWRYLQGVPGPPENFCCRRPKAQWTEGRSRGFSGFTRTAGKRVG